MSKVSSRAILTVAAFAAFLATFNETFLNVAFSPIMQDFSIDMATVQWLITANMLGAAIMVPVSTFAYRSVPTKPLFILAVCLLIAGSLVGAVSSSFIMLLCGRVIQAFGTGMIVPIAMNMVLETAPRGKLGVYMGVMGAMTTLGPSSSLIFAGGLLTFFDWHILLWFFAAISVACLLCAAFLLVDVAELTHPRLDAPSVILASLALIGLLYALSTAFTGIPPVTLATAFGGAACLVAFVSRQKKIDVPFVDLRPLAIKPFALGVAVNTLALIIVFAMNVLTPTFLQSVEGFTPLMAAAAIFPAIMLACVIAPIAGRIYDAHGIRMLLPAGFALIAIFVMCLSFSISRGSILLIALLYAPMICGTAFVIGPAQSFALSQLPRDLNPHGVTIVSTSFQIAGCIGSSLFSGIYTASIGLGSTWGADAPSAFAFLLTGIIAALLAVFGLVLALRGAAYGGPGEEESPSSMLGQIMEADVYSLKPADTVADALRLFVSKGISGAPIVEPAGRVVGFMSDGDVMRYLADQEPAFKNAWSFIVQSGNKEFDKHLEMLAGISVLDIATKDVISVNIHSELGEVCRVLTKHHLKKAPVMEKGSMVGVVNRSNITAYSVASFIRGV